jgi:glyoxylase-like metal-dependent hydrolase (beta-lactamase superfamily II)
MMTQYQQVEARYGWALAVAWAGAHVAAADEPTAPVAVFRNDWATQLGPITLPPGGFVEFTSIYRKRNTGKHGSPSQEIVVNNKSTHVPALRWAFAAAAVIVGCIGLHPGAAVAQRDSPVIRINAEAARSDISIQTLRGNISVLTGSGGNIAVITGTDGKLLVDAGIAISRPKLAAALDRVSPASVKYIINTHWHWDHTDGNAWLHERGATIIAHKNTLKHLSETVRVDDWSFTFQPVSPAGRPTSIITNQKTVEFDGESILIKYYGPSHTDGDLSIYFPKADVLVTGDTWWNGIYPFIDYSAGGGIDGMIVAANANIDRATDRTLVIPGHGPVGGRVQLIDYRDMLVAIRENVSKLKKRGMSLAEIIAAKPTGAYDKKWGQFVIDPAFFTRLVYKGVR